MGKRIAALLVIALAAAPLVAQTIEVDDLACVPLQPHSTDGSQENNHAVVTASVTGADAGSEVRLYFRRLSPDVEDFYYTLMQPAGQGRYWGVLPDPEDHEITISDPGQWSSHQAGDPDRSRAGGEVERSWLTEGSSSDLAAWLADQTSEPVEYYGAIFNASGAQRARSDLKVASVREDCSVTLDPKQRGEAENQTIGETAQWQNNELLYHWECDHIVSRINYSGVKEADSVCRACVVAVIPFWIPATVAAAAVGGIVLCESETGACEEDGSPSEP
jgi:hypothetical protein